ncbi:MAG: ATP-binding protein [Acetatifactor sp.]|nr:ATP-binding protein [Acetatifactor sp.]
MGLSKQQYDQIIRDYEHTRDYNRHLLDERRRKVYEKIPPYRILDESIGGIASKRVRLAIEGDSAALEDLHEEINNITIKKKSLLTDGGFPVDYLDPIYNCPDCLDTGYVNTDDGLKAKCHCFKDREISILYDQSNIRGVLATENFTTLSYDYYVGEDLELFKRAVQKCHELVDNFDTDPDNIFLYGTVGTGKSFLSGCVANELINKGRSVLYFSSVKLFNDLAHYTFTKDMKEELYDFYADLYNTDLLIIDDLGTEVTNGFVSTQLFACLNERQLRKKSTVISTNLSLEELRDRYSDRVFSRITSNYQICKLSGPDIRMYRKNLANVV